MLSMQVGQAAPVVAALIKGTDKERMVSEQYGGSGGDNASTDAVYAAIGNVSCLHKMPCLWFLPRKVRLLSRGGIPCIK